MPMMYAFPSEEFQFHKGAIRTSPELDIYLPNGNFNSIKVRLELLIAMIPIKSLSDFNSIKVRLEPVNP